MRRKRQRIPARRECNSMHPASRVVQELATDGVERQSLAPGRWFRPLIHSLNVGREHSSVRISRAGSQEDGIGVPGQRSNRTADRLLQVLRNPPVVLFLEVAYRDHAGTRPHGEFLFRWGPADKCRSAIDPKKHQSRLPSRRGPLPDVGIAICSSCQHSILVNLAIGNSG